ncbi:MAG: folate family ECF transporter S component, partial [Clostridiales bacterium]|nr:folate family ECF transporter S component [Clostridiales bacterium]
MNQKNSIRMIVFGGLFIALSIALSRLMSVTVPIEGIPGVRLSFGLVPVIVAGVLFGPVTGFMVGALSDFIGMLIFPSGPYFPGFTLTYALSGALPSFFVSDIRIRWEKTGNRRSLHMRYSFDWSKFRTVYPLLVGIAISQLLNSAALNTLWISLINGKAYIALLPARIVTQAILTPIFALVSYTVVLIYRGA